ncbi:MAG: discoidin domain-containing protein, partial [Bacteroidales bacterium]
MKNMIELFARRSGLFIPLLSFLLILFNYTQAVENESVYSVQVTIPAYDPGNSEHFLISAASGWSHINDSDKKHFYVEPGDYTSLGGVTITADGSEGNQRTISLYNGNNTHPAKLSAAEQANVELVFDDAHYWVVDRMSGINKAFAGYCFTVRNRSQNIVLNRFHLTNFYGGIIVQGTEEPPYTQNNTIQNSRFDPMSAAGIDADRLAILLDGSPWNGPFTLVNTKILNNEIRNCNDGVMPIRHPELIGGHEVDYPGTIVDCNHIYVDSDVYTDGSGNHDPNGLWAWTENAIDLKGGSNDPNNPMIVSNNYMWGYRRTDINGGGSTSWGTASDGHYHVKNVIIKDNVIFDSNRGITFAAPGGLPYSVENATISGNIIYDIGKSPTGTIEYGNFYYSSKNVAFDKNTIVGVNKASRWFAHESSELDMTVSCNVIINSYQMTGTRNSTTTVGNNTFYNTTMQYPGDGVYYPNASDANMADLTFTTDTYTNNPRNITIPGVVTTSSSPHANGCFGSLPGQATNPSPSNDSTGVAINKDLSWTAGSSATSHDVYFGTSNPPAFVQNQAGTSYDPGILSNSTTYYWRIDEKNASGVTEGSVWSFTTESGSGGAISNLALFKPVTYSSQENDSSRAASNVVDNIDNNGDLRWSAGPMPQWVEVDLGKDYLLSKTELVCYLDRAYQFKVEIKTDGGSTYTQVVNRLNNTQPGSAASPITDTFGEAIGRYVRLTVTGAAVYTGTWASILEFRVFGRETGFPDPASNPNPVDTATNIPTVTSLSWTAGSGAESHDVYFGTTNPPPFIGNQADTVYVPDTLSNSATYYWRIDEKNTSGTTVGAVWSFTTAVALPGQASNPDPVDMATNIPVVTSLNWTAGSDAESHDVYFGTTNPPPFIGNQADTVYVPDTLSNS